MLKISEFTGGVAQTNGYLVKTEAGACLAVDAPEGMADWLETEGALVTDLLMTHQHFDHIQDAGAIQTRHGCRLHGFAPFSRELTLEMLFSFATGTSLHISAFTMDDVLEGKSSVQVGGLEWHLEHIPGHSLDSIVFISRSNRLVFGGDVLFQDGVGRADFPGGDMELLVQGIHSKLLVLDDDFVIYPGHGPSTTIGRERDCNPFLEG